MSVKKSFVIRIDNEIYKALEKWASDDFRSVNGQMEYLLDKALKESGRRKTPGSSSSASSKKSS